MLTTHPRHQKNLDENQLLKELDVCLNEKFDLTKQALVKIMQMEYLEQFDKNTPLAPGHIYKSFKSYSQDFPAIISRLEKSPNLKALASDFLALLYMPFGIRLIDEHHSSYMNLRSRSQESKKNTDEGLFKGTASRRFVHGFSNHAYTFGYYLSLNRYQLSNEELSCITDLFYYAYIKENYHSYCEVDAAFLRISENYGYPELTCNTPTEEPVIVEEATPIHGRQPSGHQNSTPIMKNNEKIFKKFNLQIAIFKIKVKELRTNNISASNEAESLYNKLTTLKNNYVDKIISLEQYQQDSITAINQARPVLEVHRGCKELLVNIALAIAGIGFIYLAVCAFRGSFFKCNTDSINLLNGLNDSIRCIAQDEHTKLRGT